MFEYTYASFQAKFFINFEFNLCKNCSKMNIPKCFNEYCQGFVIALLYLLKSLSFVYNKIYKHLGEIAHVNVLKVFDNNVPVCQKHYQ